MRMPKAKGFKRADKWIDKYVVINVAALEQDTDELPRKMRLKSDAVIVNQGDSDSEEELIRNGKKIRVLNRKERGVGKSRNLALDNAWGDVVLFSDEDIVYEDDYAARIIQAFRRRPDADLILFNVRVNPNRRTYWTEKSKRVHWFNCGRYPTFSAAVRLDKLKDSGVRFSHLFGGGAPYSNGEDSLFFMDCIRAGLKVYAVSSVIGTERSRRSTWFKGYDEKFFFDRGVLYHFLYGKMAVILGFRYLFKNRSKMCSEKGLLKCWGLLIDGVRHGSTIS